ncbi:ferric reductase-like transmembrane domain-containing protein [Catenulispora pinisilvae]|uniref:ferric reductase-like transmembrane domain-containing protein n=1 Tax=Catenulispora pinisilvae TaxID=2705253 RepID=UPI00189241A8|nr:ferric reductase-like transmembrane domain-containing protein [Catenulispora pinisilvae]
MDSTVIWYTGQATGIVTLVLFSLVMVLGISVRRQVRLPGLPRLAAVALHRSISLLAVAFLAVHILTAVIDSYVDISLLAVVVPFSSSYEPLWIGLGAVALDLILAVVITSLLRARIGRRTWRAVHWLAYACWPVAIVHGITLGSGTGHPMTGWPLWLTIACVAVVLAAVAQRVATGRRALTPADILAAAPARSAAAREYATSASVGTHEGVRR